MYRILYCAVCFICMQQYLVVARLGPGDSEQDWGYITVRPNAHMFWWLYYTTADVSNYAERPLIIWLQGGPGMPSSGYGNFGELGPQTTELETRENSTVNYFNILFVDNPAGVGYSYFSDNATKLVADGNEIAKDLCSFFRQWMKMNPTFKDTPIYVFGESYGGKMATEFVYYMLSRHDLENVTANLRGLGLGDSYISPIDYVEHYAPLAYHLGLIDKRGFARIDELAQQIQVLISRKEYECAIEMSNFIIDKLFTEMVSIDMYNMMKRRNESSLPGLFDHLDQLTLIMNDEVKQKLGIYENITWSFYSDEVHLALKANFISSVTDKIEYLLNNTHIKIIVYNGVMDFLVNTAGTVAWLDKLNWPGKGYWIKENQTPLEIDNMVEGYKKSFNNLIFYAVLRAGHSVPADNLIAMNEILQRELLP